MTCWNVKVVEGRSAVRGHRSSQSAGDFVVGNNKFVFAFCAFNSCLTMPLFCINTNVPRGNVSPGFIQEMSKLVSKLTGKPEGVS